MARHRSTGSNLEGVGYGRGVIVGLSTALALAAPAAAGGPKADLGDSVLKPHTMRVGLRSVFQIRVVNHGPDPAGHVVIKDHVSKRGRITLARVIGATSPVKCTVETVARCPIPIVAAHDHVTMTVAVRGRRRGRLIDSSHVSSSVPDPHPANDRDKVAIRIRRASRA
jgi:hypothetical protein